MRIGLISDTHGFLDPQVPALFAGVEHILHAGDIGNGRILVDLERIAPLTAVLGNNDHGIAGLDCRETEVVELAGLSVLVHHIVNPRAAAESIGTPFRREAPHIVVFGHTHTTFDQVVEGVRFVNPGYAGRQRFSLERTLALMEIQGDRIDVRFQRL